MIAVPATIIIAVPAMVTIAVPALVAIAVPATVMIVTPATVTIAVPAIVLWILLRLVAVAAPLLSVSPLSLPLSLRSEEASAFLNPAVHTAPQ